METQIGWMATAAAGCLLVALLKERRDVAALYLAALTLGFGVWSAGRALARAELALGAMIALASLAPAASAALAEEKISSRAYRHALWIVPSVLWAALAFPLPAGHPFVFYTALAWLVTGLVLGTRTLARSRSVAREPESPEATRLRYLAIAEGLVVAAVAFDSCAAWLARPRLAGFVVPLLFLYTGYLHLARVRVKDLRQLMGNTIALSFMASGLAATFAVLWLWVGPRLDAFVLHAFVASFALLLFLEPARTRIQALMDRYFVAGRLELERVFRPLVERLSHVLTLDEFLREVLETTESTGRIRASAIYLRDDPHVGFQQVGSFGLPPRRRIHLIRQPVWVSALERTLVLQIDELERAMGRLPESQELESVRLIHQTMMDLDAQVVLPLCSGNRLVGFWTLTDESTHEPFSSNEIELLREVAAQMALSVDNTKTFERVRARDRLAMLGEMSAGLAHEIRNPLGTIRGSIPLLDDPDAETAAEIRRGMIEEIDRLDRLVDAFLNYAQPSTARSTTLTDVAELVHGTASHVARGRADSNSVKLEFRIEPDLPEITANAEHLERVLMNVLLNAYEAVEGQGRIEVAAHRAPDSEDQDGEADAIEIVVADTGPGFDESTLERAFIPFFTTKLTGTGLGLPLCERLVRAQGGSIRVDSQPGVRTEVTIRMPVRGASADPAIGDLAGDTEST